MKSEVHIYKYDESKIIFMSEWSAVIEMILVLSEHSSNASCTNLTFTAVVY